RKELWEYLLKFYLKTPFRKLEPVVKHTLLLGAAGILDVSGLPDEVIVNALVQCIKEEGYSRSSRLVNAVLRRFSNSGRKIYQETLKKTTWKCQSLIHGVPLSLLPELSKGRSPSELQRLLKCQRIRPYLSLRSDNGSVPERTIEHLRVRGYRCWKSDLLPSSIRLASSAYPPSLPGYESGIITPQSESSMMVGNVVADLYRNGRILDMCAGRGIKTGQILKLLPRALVEAWDISPGRLFSAQKEFTRLGVSGRVTIRQGNSLAMVPEISPSLVLVDAPCSGSGTWPRHPESKWKLSVSGALELSALQRNLLEKACNIVAPGGIVVYSTCSLLKEENENVIGRLLGNRSSIKEIPVPLDNPYIRKGVPYGIYTWPELPWLDGFFIAVVQKRD
ncbi:MAG: RsmB/NOP family class I SAM-dependent RNA methyltransferase, partial [Synergistales bacterium]|nr:RsmB/NOP family class I SAM-dependent RNA methyltransferase [Synergistales bacterium]